jgi:hypothetical protein
MNKIDVWTKSPITEKDMVLQEFDEKSGVSKMDLSSGYYTNEYPLNYKKNPKFDISKYESSMPDLIKDLRHDDGESYWYPTTIQTETDMLFPVGTVIATADDGETQGDEVIKWCYAKVKKLTENEKKEYSKDIEFESKLDMENALYFIDFLQAAKKVSGFSLGNI